MLFVFLGVFFWRNLGFGGGGDPQEIAGNNTGEQQWPMVILSRVRVAGIR